MDSNRWAVQSPLSQPASSHGSHWALRHRVKGSHAKWMATGSKHIHVRRSLWALNHCRHQSCSERGLSLRTLPSKPDAGSQVQGQILLFLYNKELTQGLVYVLKISQFLLKYWLKYWQGYNSRAVSVHWPRWFILSRTTEVQGPVLLLFVSLCQHLAV